MGRVFIGKSHNDVIDILSTSLVIVVLCSSAVYRL